MDQQEFRKLAKYLLVFLIKSIQLKSKQIKFYLKSAMYI